MTSLQHSSEERYLGLANRQATKYQEITGKNSSIIAYSVRICQSHMYFLEEDTDRNRQSCALYVKVSNTYRKRSKVCKPEIYRV